MWKRVIIWGYLLLVVSTGVVFAAQSNQLNIYGVAHIVDNSLAFLPLLPVPDSQGRYFSSDNLPAGLALDTADYEAGTYDLYIIKQSDLSEPYSFSISLNAMNPTNFVWSNGSIRATAISGAFSAASATLSHTTLEPQQDVTVTINFQTRANMDADSVDEELVTVSYLVNGIRQYAYINVFLLPSSEDNDLLAGFDVKFAVTYSGGNQIQYMITVSNNSGERFTNWRFRLGMPDDTLYQVWNSGGSVIDQNHFTGYGLEAGTGITLSGALTLPEGYDLRDYLSPSITGMMLNFNEEDYPVGWELLPQILSLTLRDTHLTMDIGTAHFLETVREPANAPGTIKWTSSNSNVVFVSHYGRIQAVGRGTAVITARLGDVYTTCDVTVSDHVVPIIVEFEVTNTWPQNIQYQITVTNILNKPVSEWSFRILLPEGTTGYVYNGASFDDGIFRGTTAAEIPADSSVSFSGHFEIPAEYNINTWLDPAILDIHAQ